MAWHESFDSDCDAVFRFEGFRRAISEIESAVVDDGDIVLVGPPGVGMTTLLRHLATFSGMGNQETRFSWSPPTNQSDNDWIIRDSIPIRNGRTNERCTAMLVPAIQNTRTQWTDRPRLISIQPMRDVEALPFLDWCHQMGRFKEATAQQMKRLYRSHDGRIGSITRAMQERRESRAA